MSYAPIVLFVYNRPEHTRKTLEALSKNELAQQSVLYIFSDGPKEGADTEVVEKIKETRAIAASQPWCKQIYITERANNWGLAASIIDGVTQIVNEHGRIIVLEDDMITSPRFLNFLNDALGAYEHIAEVACISGYNYPVNGLPKTFFLRGADCWGWATWKRAWSGFEKNGKTLLEWLLGNNATNDFDFYNSYPYTQMLRDQMGGKNDSWAIRWYASCYVNNQLCLYPGKSFLKNIGFDGSGIHCVAQESAEVKLNTGIKLRLVPAEEDVAAKMKIAAHLKGSNAQPITRTFLRKIVAAFYNRTLKRVSRNNNSESSVEYGWSGDFNTWAEASALCDGYDKALILDKCKQSLLKVKNGEAVHERDSVLFDRVEYSWPLVAALLKAALENDGNLCVLDFGGSLGSSYFQNRTFLEGCKKITWCIVEQQSFIECGKEYFEDENLKFYGAIDAVINEQQPEIAVLSGVLPYLENPYSVIEQIVAAKIKYIIVDNMPFNREEADRITVQKVWPAVYEASYPCWFLDYRRVLHSFLHKYNIVSEHEDASEISLDNIKHRYKGFLLKHK